LTMTLRRWGVTYQHKAVYDGHEPQVDRIAAQARVTETEQQTLTTEVGTYDHGMGVVRIRSRPVSASTKPLRVTSKFAGS
jgi:hypothetical protein